MSTKLLVVNEYQPLASLMRPGLRTLLTRPQNTNKRGLLGIRASNTLPRWAKLQTERDPWRSYLASAGFKDWRDLPLGALVAVALLDEIRPARQVLQPMLSEPNRVLNVFLPGHYAWFLSDVVALPDPIPLAASGLALWETTVGLPDSILASLYQGFDEVQPESGNLQEAPGGAI